ncbi:uncharacterized protein LOC107458233 isoform X2 [Arachis duranensis]|uniref:Uncharacterized protein LOC107458233 isoform X2 n=1 Tax=Arachis duranensis TaxID=130453 RepID=A0A6P5MKE2_ARADU|nr:uncharacterized protein LOC107458233 isoform X2 [Arachis duranensis]
MHARREEGLARSVAPPLLSVPVPSPSPLVHLGAAVEAESRRERVRESERAANLEPPRPVTSSPSLPSGATGDGLPRNYAAIAGKTLPPPLPPKTAAESSVLFIASCRRSGHWLWRWCCRNRHLCCHYLVPSSTASVFVLKSPLMASLLSYA